MFSTTNSVAAGGANASAFGPTAASTLPVFCFFSYGFLANGQDLEMASPSPELPRLTFYFAPPSIHSQSSFTISVFYTLCADFLLYGNAVRRYAKACLEIHCRNRFRGKGGVFYGL